MLTRVVGVIKFPHPSSVTHQLYYNVNPPLPPALQYPTPDSPLLKSSKIGKAVMLLYRHPKETRRNKEKAGKLISKFKNDLFCLKITSTVTMYHCTCMTVDEWARPIFGVASDLKSLSRDKREERDYAHLSQAARRRLSSGERRTSQDEEYQ